MLTLQQISPSNLYTPLKNLSNTIYRNIPSQEEANSCALQP